MTITEHAGDALVAMRLTKLYPIARSQEKRTAVDHLDLTVEPGEIFGFLGPNGAGKTTTIKMLLGFIRPTSGSATIFGESIETEAARSAVGYVPEQPYFPKFLTCFELIRTHGELCGMSLREAGIRAEECLALVKMSDVRHTPLSQLSKGMTQRIGLACALVGDPRMLILDEPASGLDPAGRRELREMLVQFKSEGRTVFVSSHLLSEMESVCDRLGILAKGKLVAYGAPDSIVQARDEMLVEFDGAADDPAVAQHIGLLGGAISADDATTPASGLARGVRKALVPSRSLYDVVDMLHQRKARLLAVTPGRESLEDAFLRLVQGATR
jgi:ABC-2 type transport system ATP-binding protein